MTSMDQVLADERIIWHQGFTLPDGRRTPGPHDLDQLLALAELPLDLAGLRALDVGTTNGGTAFELERRGARVVAIDVVDDARFGFAAIRAALGSDVEFRQVSLYELPTAHPGERFDLVVCWGVLYHLRHPLLGLDALRAVTADRLSLETAVADDRVPGAAGSPLAEFHRTDELGADTSNWFSPTVRCLEEWVGSCGFAVERTLAWPDPAARALVTARAVPGAPEWQRISYEAPLACRTTASAAG